MYTAIPISLVFIGCCSNVVFLEYMVKAHPGSGNIITFSQFLFIALEGFIFQAKFGTKSPKIPIKNYLLLVAVFFSTSTINNYAFNFNIPLPLHMIFRSGSLIANFILGILILKRSYKLNKYLSVISITLGIAICSVVSATSQSKNSQTEDDPHGMKEFGRWSIGITLLTIALFLSARMGIFQEELYSKYGKHPKEALFYNHALPLPAFALLSHDIYKHVELFNQSEAVTIPLLTIGIPIMWLFLFLNMITQYVCIRSVFVLTSECPSLTVTLVVTLRKFVSLLFSIWYFQNQFTAYHWFGTFLVFGGTLMFLDLHNQVAQMLNLQPKTKKVE